MRPWLSVLIPTYNGENYLSYALNSIVAQRDQDIECIAVDDGSADNTLSILNEYQNKLPIIILQQGRHGNWVANTNYALSHAKGDYVCFLHQDDLWLDNRLKIMRQIIENFPDVVLFLHPSYFIDSKGASLGLWSCPLPHYPNIIPPNQMLSSLLIQNYISIVAPIFKQGTALKVNGMDESLWYTADWDFWLKISSCGDTLYYPKPLSGFRIHPMSQTVTRSLSLNSFREQLEGVAKRHLESWQVPELQKNSVSKIVDFSIEVNVTLAEMLHIKNISALKLLAKFLLLGPSKGYRYIRVSRILERISARLRARLQSR